MQTNFSSEFFIKNRQKLRESVKKGIPIVITANGSMQRGGDEPMPFHQDSNFWYLTGISGANLVLVLLDNKTYVIVPGLSAVREAFDGAHDLDTYAKQSGITEFLPEREGWQHLRSDIQKAKAAATLASPPPYLKSYGLHTLPYRRRLIQRLKRMAPDLTIHDIRTSLATQRSIKQPQELQALQQAIDITCATLQEIAKNSLREVKHEYEIEAALSYGFRARGSNGHAFAPIVGAGNHGTTLHYLSNEGPVKSDDLIVLDVGAEVEHYAADITRTVSQSPITGRRAEVFKAVATSQDYALSLIKPGVMLRDYEQAVEKFIGEQLLRLHVITEPSRDQIRQYFPHATSHFLGLDTHDVGDYRESLEAGMVITCEPGIYIPEEGIGVRLEDDVLITQDGCKVLSQACPQALTTVQ